MANQLAFLLDSECNRLDSHAGAFCENTELKQFRLKLREVLRILRDVDRYTSEQDSLIKLCFIDLKNLAYNVDELIDNWEQSEISNSKFDQEVSRIHGSLVRLLNLYHKLVAVRDRKINSVSEVSYGKSVEYPVFERHDETFENIIDFMLRHDDNGVHIIPIVSTGGIGKTVLARRIYNDERVKIRFPFRTWVSFGQNLDFSTFTNELRVLSSKIRSAENVVDHREALNKRFLIVLDDVWDKDDGKLEKLRLLFSVLRGSGSSVLLTTRYGYVAALLGTVPAHCLKFPRSKPKLRESLEARKQVQSHGKGVKGRAMRSVVTTESLRQSTSGRTDYTTSDLSTFPSPYTKSLIVTDEYSVPSSKNLLEDEMTSSPQIRIYSEPMFVVSKDPASSPENLTEDKITSPPQIVTPYTESMSAVDEDPSSSPENLTEDDTRSPHQKEMLTVHESEIKLASLQAGELAAHVPQAIVTTSDGKDRIVPIYETKFEAGCFRKEGEGQAILVSDAYVQQSVEPVVPMAAMLDTSNVTTEKSISKNMLKIFKCVNDAKVSIIGVHGIGGIGKTAVLKDLISYPNMKSMFHVIILVTVSRCWNTRKIQNEVLRQLSLSCEDYETVPQVARKLLGALNGKKFLLLLDDVWEQIDLEAVGIPVPSSKNECKIIVASREPDVCRNGNVSKVIELETLPWKEAWKLFCKQVGRIIQSPDIQPFARAIVKGCCGVPLLIIVTGRALMGENNISVWEHASKNFSLPSTSGICHTKDVILLLKFSWDQLKDHDIKCCFLYCGLFPEDREVNIFQFIDYCIQEGIIGGTGADAHKRGCDIVDVLVHASLLQVTECVNSIRMHSLIRDLALGILSSAAKYSPLLMRVEGDQFLLRAYSRLTESSNTGSSSSSSSLTCPKSSKLLIPETHQFLSGAGADLSEPPSEEEWKLAKMIFLMDNNLCTLPERPSCPSLLTLFLQRNLRLRVIPPSFFESMTSLKVLNLSKTRINSLPKTIVKLQNLEILILHDCERLFMLPPEVGSLESLEVLDLRGTEINKLPNEIGKLASLRYLEVFFYGSVDESEYVKLPCNLISTDTIAGLQALETLSIVVHPTDERWYKDVKSVITEVNKLTKLSSLCFHFPEVEHVKKFLNEGAAWKDQGLTKFKFVVGDDAKSFISGVPNYVESDYNQQGKCLRFVNGEEIYPEVVDILTRSTAFYLDHHLRITSLSEFEVSNINGLRFCIVSECASIETVVDIKWHTTAVFPILQNLSIHHLSNLTCICKGIIPDGSFAELRILSVHMCPKLKYVFTSSMIRLLSKLEELEVEDCPAIESIILENESCDSNYIALPLPSLKKLRLHYLPELVNIWRTAWPSLEYISFYDCPQLKKLCMDSKLKDSLIEIKAEKNWWQDTDLPSHLVDRLTFF